MAIIDVVKYQFKEGTYTLSIQDFLDKGQVSAATHSPSCM